MRGEHAPLHYTQPMEIPSPTNSGAINLAHCVVLLSLDPGSGRRRRRSIVAFAAAGALLVELETAGRIALRDRRVHVTDATATGDGALDSALALIAADQPRPPARWVSRLRDRGRLASRLLDDLLTAGIVTRSPRRTILGWRYPVRDRMLLAKLRESARRGLGTPTSAPADSAALGGLMCALRLGANIAPQTTWRERLAALRTLRKRLWQVDAAARAIAQAQSSSG